MRPPPDTQLFEFGVYEYNVDAAGLIIAAKSRPARPVNPRDLAGFFTLGVIAVDLEHARTVDLNKPLIGACIPEQNGAAMIIDGWHRVRRAIDDDEHLLFAHILNPLETVQIRRRIR